MENTSKDNKSGEDHDVSSPLPNQNTAKNAVTNGDSTSKTVPGISQKHFPSKHNKGWLKLCFSNAVDRPRLDSFFDPANKNKIDPSEYVLVRETAFFDPALNDHTAFLEDQDGKIRTVTLAYHLNDPINPPKTGHDFTEIGTTLTDINGFQAGVLIIAACSMKEWWLSPPNRIFAAMVKDNNIPSQKTFQKLGWDKVNDDHLADEIGAAADQTLQNQAQTFVQKKQSTDPNDAQTWHIMTPYSLCMQAQILIHFMDAGELFNRKTGERIDIDLSCLDTIGLTRSRLEALANGQLNKNILENIDPNAPTSNCPAKDNNADQNSAPPPAP